MSIQMPFSFGLKGAVAKVDMDFSLCKRGSDEKNVLLRSVYVSFAFTVLLRTTTSS
jgi:hypothetical protein